MDFKLALRDKLVLLKEKKDTEMHLDDLNFERIERDTPELEENKEL